MATKTAKTTLAQLRKEASRLGVTVELDEDCQCYRAYCPPGFYFEPVLHEYIAVFGGGLIGNGQTKAEARADLLDQLQFATELEPCDVSGCDYCK